MCCVTGHLLAFYVDRVFKDHQEPDPHILRRISGIANSFLHMQKMVQQCVSHWAGILSFCSMSVLGRAQDILAPAGLLKEAWKQRKSPAPSFIHRQEASCTVTLLPRPTDIS